MVLALDIGNTTTAIGIFRGMKLRKTLSIPSKPLPSLRYLTKEISALLTSSGVLAKDIEGAVISSVVPRVTATFTAVIRQKFHIRPLVISGSMNCGINIRYHPLGSLGADRICHAVAAFQRYGGPCIVIDLGTATTLDVISNKGVYLGGAIMAGIDTAARGLHESTAKLPAIRYRFPATAIGTSTQAGIQSGILFGMVDAVEGMVGRIRRQLGARATVVATGGFSTLIAGKTHFFDHINPWLVLEGALAIYHLHHPSR